MSVLDRPLHHQPQSSAPASRRAMHFVGSLPSQIATSDRAAMQWILDQCGDAELFTLPCDRDTRWIIDWLIELRHRDALELTLDGDCSNYRCLPMYQVRRGHRLTPGDLRLGRHNDIAAVLAARRELNADSLPPHQVSIPAPLDLCLFTFGVPAATMGLLPPIAAARALAFAVCYLPAFTDAVVDEIRQIHAYWGEHVRIQLESPAILVAYDRAPRFAWRQLTAALARHTATVLTAAPPTTRFVLHSWCHGDLGHQPIASLRELTPMVAFHNRLAERLRRSGRPMPPVHAALCDSQTPPSTDPRDFAALRHLPSDIDLIAGLVDEGHPDASAIALRHTEHALGRPVRAVAAACGHGRRSVAAATANATLARRLTAER